MTSPTQSLLAESEASIAKTEQRMAKATAHATNMLVAALTQEPLPCAVEREWSCSNCGEICPTGDSEFCGPACEAAFSTFMEDVEKPRHCETLNCDGPVERDGLCSVCWAAALEDEQDARADEARERKLEGWDY